MHYYVWQFHNPEVVTLAASHVSCQHHHFYSGSIVSMTIHANERAKNKIIQPQRIISGLRETFIKRCIVETTNKTEKDQKNRARKQSC